MVRRLLRVPDKFPDDRPIVEGERDLLAGIVEFERQRPQVRSEALRIGLFRSGQRAVRSAN